MPVALHRNFSLWSTTHTLFSLNDRLDKLYAEPYYAPILTSKETMPLPPGAWTHMPKPKASAGKTSDTVSRVTAEMPSNSYFDLSKALSDAGQSSIDFRTPHQDSESWSAERVQTSLTCPLPEFSRLRRAIHSVQQNTHDPKSQLAWCRNVFLFIDRSLQLASSAIDLKVGPIVISDPELSSLSNVAVPLVLKLASSKKQPVPSYTAEAIYMRALFSASGTYPEHVPHDPRKAFRDFETAARAGYGEGWFRLGRDYENFDDSSRAKACFERGVKLGIGSCIYRMGMAHLLGQLDLPPNPPMAVYLLHRASLLASVELPHSAYIYSLLLTGEFTECNIPLEYFTPYIPPSSSPAIEARIHLERAAYFHFSPAQYKIGHSYEFADPPFPFDPVMSVQYYSLACEQGEPEAAMALSKWFLCGSGRTVDGVNDFEKDEDLAWAFASKAAEAGLPSAEFAMGYYAEIGVGQPKDLAAAMDWYIKALEHDNPDAADRLAALSNPAAGMLSRKDHESITESQLLRKRTLAKRRADSDAQSSRVFHKPRTVSSRVTEEGGVIDIIRRTSMRGVSNNSSTTGSSCLSYSILVPPSTMPPVAGLNATPSLDSVSALSLSHNGHNEPPKPLGGSDSIPYSHLHPSVPNKYIQSLSSPSPTQTSPRQKVTISLEQQRFALPATPSSDSDPLKPHPSVFPLKHKSEHSRSNQKSFLIQNRKNLRRHNLAPTLELESISDGSIYSSHSQHSNKNIPHAMWKNMPLIGRDKELPVEPWPSTRLERQLTPPAGLGRILLPRPALSERAERIVSPRWLD